MCFGSKSKATPPPAAAPAPPVEPPEETEIGGKRKEENQENFGNNRGPNYRVKRGQSPSLSPDAPIKM